MPIFSSLRQRLLLSLCLFCSMPVLSAQDFSTDYEVLQSQAPIPKNILTKAYQKSTDAIETEIGNTGSRRSQKNKRDFIIQTNFVIDQLLQSHKLLFNTPLNKMVESMADELLKDEPKLREKLNFYIIKTSEVNAFATDRGDIFVTIGLIARVQTEAELAFILAHEMVHVREKHSLEGFDYKAKIERNSRFQLNKSVDVLLEKSNYSQSMEKEADEEGLELFSKSKYALEAVISSFKILQYAHTPVCRKELVLSAFELPNISFREEVWLEKAGEIKPLSEDEDEYSTHPATKERIEAISEKMLDVEPKERSQFVKYTAKEYANLVAMANLELGQIYLQEQLYVEAVYQNYGLLRDYPNNKFVQENFVYSIYGIAQYLQLEDGGSILDNYDFDSQDDEENEYLQGELKRVHHFFKELTQKELTILAASHCWELHLKYPEDEKIRRMARDMIEDVLIYTVEEDPADYFKAAPIDTALMRKYPSFTRIAFADYLGTEKFQEYLKSGVKYRKEKVERNEKMETYAGRQEEAAERKKDLKNGKNLGLKKVVFINPLYYKADISRYGKLSIDYEKSEEVQGDMKGYIKETTKSVGLKSDVLDINGLRKSDAIEIMQDIFQIQQWKDEYFNHPSYMVSCTHNEAMAVCEKYGTDNFVFTGVVGLRSKSFLRPKVKGLSSAGSLLLLFFPETAPVGIYSLLGRKKEMYYYSTTIDVGSYRSDLQEVNYIEMADKEAVVKQHLYWTATQLKRTKKKK